MKALAHLCATLEQLPAGADPAPVVAAALAPLPAADALAMLRLLAGLAPRRWVSMAQLRQRLMQVSQPSPAPPADGPNAGRELVTDLPEWLLVQCERQVGDSAETVALLWPESATCPLPPPTLADGLAQLEAARRAGRQPPDWAALPGPWPGDPALTRLWARLLTGQTLVKLPQPVLLAALAQLSPQPRPVLAQWLACWLQPGHTPEPAQWLCLHSPATPDPQQAPAPWPFAGLATTPCHSPPDHPAAWLVDTDWGGQRAQLLRRPGRWWLWLADLTLCGDRCPELADAALALPDDCALEGWLLAWQGDRPLPDSALAQRLARAQPGAAALASTPLVFIADDLLHHQGHNLLDQPLAQRRQRLLALPGPWDSQTTLRRATPRRHADTAALLADCAQALHGGALGLCLRWDGGGAGGTHTPDPPDDGPSAPPLQRLRGTGQRLLLVLTQLRVLPAGGLELSLAAWSGPPSQDRRELLPLVRLPVTVDQRLPEDTGAGPWQTELLGWSRQHTLERFGPVRSVAPTQVFAVAVAGWSPSRRHRSGWVAREPRLLAWCREHHAAAADTAPGSG